jgi:hypothetical protein
MNRDEAVRELIDSARAVLPFLSRPERTRLALAIAEAVNAEEKPQVHEFVPAEFGPRDICQHHTYGYFVCGEPSDAPIHQKEGK